MAGSKPLIAVTGPETAARASRACIALGLGLAGAEVVQLRPSYRLPPDEYDAIVISGGHDVEPVLYKSAAKVEGNYDPERDAFEVEMIDQTLAAGKPILGICRGAQLLNVCLGGDLIQDLQQVQQGTRRRRTVLPLKTISISPGSMLAAHLGKTRMRVNSLHNQSVDRLGLGLEVVARDNREVVQAIEDPERPYLVGVQWHPEYLLYQRASRRLFGALVEATRNAAG